MPKKTTTQIEKYYKKSNVASSYDKRRFSGIGGKYINEEETVSIVKILHRYLPSDSKVLDLGAGRGRLSIPLSSSGFTVYCLDSSEEMLKYLMKHFKKTQILIQSCFDPIKTRGKFDAITSLRFFDHFNARDQNKIIKNTLQALKPSGIIAYSCLNAISLESLVSSLFSYGRYNYYYPYSQYNTIFSKNKLEVIDRVGVFFLPRGVFLKFGKSRVITNLLILIDKTLSKIFPNFCAMNIFILRRSA